MFKLKFLKTIIIATFTIVILISTNLNINSVNAQSNNLTYLQLELNSLQVKYHQFETDFINFKEILKNELINNEKNKSDWLKPVKAGISNDKKNDTFIKTYDSFQCLKNQTDKLIQFNTELENIKTQTNNLKITFPVFSKTVEQLQIIINPLNDGKLSPEELCYIQKKFGIINIFNLTESYDENKPNSCGYFFAITQAEIEKQLNKEIQKLKQEINNIQEILDFYSNTIMTSKSDSSKNEIKNYNWLVLTLILFLLFVITLIVILWQIMKPKLYINKEDKQTLDNYILTEKNSNNKQIELRKKLLKKQVNNLKKYTIKSKHNKRNSVTNVDTKTPIFSNLTDSENSIAKKLESSVGNPPFIVDYPFLETTKLILKLTEETIDEIWKGNRDKIEFEPDENGDYLVIKISPDKYYVYFNQEKKIRPEVLITCKKAGIFEIVGNVEVQYEKIKHLKPAKVSYQKFDRWQLVKSGEVSFSS